MNAKTTTLLRRILNYLLYLVLCFIIATGLIMDYRLPRGRSGKGLSVLGLDRHEWGELHTWAGYIFAGLIVFHLWLAWKWLMNIAVKRQYAYMIAGLALGLIMIAVLLLIPVSGTV